MAVFRKLVEAGGTTIQTTLSETEWNTFISKHPNWMNDIRNASQPVYMIYADNYIVSGINDIISIYAANTSGMKPGLITSGTIQSEAQKAWWQNLVTWEATKQGLVNLGQDTGAILQNITATVAEIAKPVIDVLPVNKVLIGLVVFGLAYLYLYSKKGIV